MVRWARKWYLAVVFSFMLGSSVLAAEQPVADDAALKAKLRTQIETLGEKHPDVWATTLNISIIYQRQGRFDDAAQWMQKAADISSQLFGEKHQYTLSCLNGLAVNYNKLGRYSEALALDERILKIRLEVLGEKHPDTLTSFNNLAADYRRLGRYADALSMDEKTLSLKLEVLGEKHPETLTTMGNLAVDYRSLNRQEEALELDKKVVNLRTEVQGEKHPLTVTAINNLAKAYDELGMYIDAAPLYSKALALNTEILGERHPDTFITMNNLSLVYHKLGRYAEALALDEKVVKLRSEMIGEKHPETLISLNNLASNYYIQGRYNEAAASLQKFVDGVETLRRNSDLSTENRQAFFARWIPSYKKYALLCFEQNQPEKAFNLAELTKARTLLELTARRLADGSGILSAEESQQVGQYQTKLNVLTEQIANSFGRPDEKIRIEAIKNETLREFDQYRNGLAEKYPKYKQLNEVNIVDAANGAKLVPPNAVFISYVQTDDNKLLAFVLDTVNGLKAVSLGEISGIDNAVDVYRQLLAHKDISHLRQSGKYLWKLSDGSFALTVGMAKPSEDAESVKENKQMYDFVNSVSKYLADKLIVPLNPYIQGKRQWIISPDGALTLLPFETLLVGDRMTVLDHDMSYVQSLSMMALLKQRGEAHQKNDGRKDLFAIGAAYYDVPGDNSDNAARLRAKGLKDLQSSEPELDALAGIFADKQFTIYKKDDATEAKLIEINRSKDLNKYRYILFSAHGYFDDKQPALNSIVLNQKNPAPGTDGFITVAKWPSYDLGSDLVYLSACETGRGKFIPGEGVLGLTYVFYVAGNKNTVATLWKTMDDDSAVQFTRTFFSKLRAGQDQVAALNETKRDFIADGRYSRPIFWAPFVLYGL